MQPACRNPSDVWKTRVCSRIKTGPKKDAIKQLVACHGSHAHEEEHTKKHTFWNVLQGAGEQEREKDEEVDREMCPPLLNNLGSNLLSTTAWNGFLFISCQGNQMCERPHCCSTWEWQAKDTDDGIDDASENEHVKMISSRLPQPTSWPVDQLGSKVLVQVVEQSHAKSRDESEKNCPCWQIPLNAFRVKSLTSERIDQPRPSIARVAQLHRWHQLSRYRKPLNVHVVPPDLGNCSGNQDGNRYCKI
mmetsp:Transcript_39956/g.74238  ORF Transcript_39956/g.74238 Transcript_39956/m.74238 type:complete len:247 (+) Transcript_39956:457-1197(+)